MDEARHVEVFATYIDTELETSYPIYAHLGALLDDMKSPSPTSFQTDERHLRSSRVDRIRRASSVACP
jgi:hypothetical protein